MKKLPTLLTILTIPVLAMAQPVQLWEFNDAAGTLLEDTFNSGTPGTASWAEGFGASTTNGSGQFIINDADGNAFKTAPMRTALEGVITYEMVISSWDLDEQNDPATQSFRNFGIRLRDATASSNVMNFQVQQQGNGNIRFRISDNTDVNNLVVDGYDGLPVVNQTTYTIQMILDAATGAWTLNINGSDVASGTATVGELDTLNFYKQGTYGGGTTPDFVAIDSLSLSGIAASVTWAGYEVSELGWADTTTWMGFVNVLAGDWIWSASLNNWIYMPEGSVGEGGSWGYVIGQ